MALDEVVAKSTGQLQTLYRKWLARLFACTSALRIASYLPVVTAIVASGDSAQHSLFAWGLWLISHLTMAAWMYEQNQRRSNTAIAVVLGNAVMCGLTLALVAWYRF